MINEWLDVEIGKEKGGKVGMGFFGGMESERTVGPLVRRRPRSNDLWGKRMGSVWSRLTLRHLCDLLVEIMAQRSLKSGASRFVLGKEIVYILAVGDMVKEEHKEMRDGGNAEGHA